MPMPAVPRLVVCHLLDFVQPLFRVAIHFALVNAGEKHLDGHVFKGASVGEEHVKLFYPYLFLHVPLLYGSVGLAYVTKEALERGVSPKSPFYGTTQCTKKGTRKGAFFLFRLIRRYSLTT